MEKGSQAAGSCVPSAETLCLADGRFSVVVDWETKAGASGTGKASSLTPDTGTFWYFQESNVEVIIKVLSTCSYANHFWVFAAGLTNVRSLITVTDTMTGAVNTYLSPQGTNFVRQQDTAAFACR